MIPKRDKSTDIASEIAQGKFFKKRLLQAAEEAASRFINGENLNDVMANISLRENFNQLQIQRLVEEGNTLAFNKAYDQKKTSNDRRISFELGELSIILERMGDKAPPEIENPNWVKGGLGDGEMKKTASVNEPAIYTPNSHVEAMRKRALEKKAAAEKILLEKEARTLNREIESGIFKIAQSIVQSERSYKSGNEVFNTLLSDVNFDDFLVDGIAKKAEEVADYMKKTSRVHQNFVVSLEVNPTEKVASVVLGNHSLIKKANDNTLVAPPKVMPIQDVNDYNELIDLAREIQRKQQASLEVEKQLHGGAHA